MADGAALEKRWAAMPRGFKSHPLRHVQQIDNGSYLKAEREILIYRLPYYSDNNFKERCWSGLTGAPGKRVSFIATVGSNPTLSAN